jgi:hypothetical protein
LAPQPAVRIDHVVYRFAFFLCHARSINCEADNGNAGFFCWVKKDHSPARETGSKNFYAANSAGRFQQS